MSDIDEELKKAVEESEATATATDASEASDDAGESSAAKRNLGLLITLLVMAGGILTFVLGQDSEKLTYSKAVNEVLGAEGELGERNLRVQGVLVHGSLLKREEPCEFRFKMRAKDDPDGEPLDVRYAACIVPDTFRDVKGMPVEVEAEGKLAKESGASYLEAKHIFAKCPSKYEMQQRQAAGEKMPHEQVQPGAPDPMGLEIPGQGS